MEATTQYFGKLFFIYRSSNFIALLNSVADPGSGIGYLLDPWIRDGDSSDPGCKKSRFRDKHPGSATLLLNFYARHLGIKITGP
jgi:hypothetical protein